MIAQALILEVVSIVSHKDQNLDDISNDMLDVLTYKKQGFSYAWLHHLLMLAWFWPPSECFLEPSRIRSGGK